MSSSVRFARDFTSLRVGGALECAAVASGTEDIRAALAAIASRSSQPPLVLGGGTNVVISDGGYDGLVLLLRGGECRHLSSNSKSSTAFLVDAGVSWDDFVQATIAEGCTGVEMMSGIPGSVGAAPIQNIAAYGQQIGDVVEWVEVIDRSDLSVARLTAEECGFAFRSSSFKRELRDRFVVTRVQFLLPLAQHSPPVVSTYVDIERHFAVSESSPRDLIERRAAVLTARRRKSMLLDDADPLARSAGSFFVNPRVPVELAIEMAKSFGTSRLRVDYLEAAIDADSATKRVPAAHVMRYSGLNPGDTWGPVKLSDKHLLALVTTDGATATDVWLVGHHIRTRVEAVTGIRLNFEVSFVGAFPKYDEAEFNGKYLYAPGPSPEPDWLAMFRSNDGN